MKARKSGKRHPLLLYRRAMRRLFTITLILGILLTVLWILLHMEKAPILAAVQAGDLLLFAGAVVSLSISLFTFFAQYMAYVQARPNHLVIVTPFLKLKVSYRRFRSLRPASLQKLFPPAETKGSNLRALEPFYGMTAMVVELNGYPMSPLLLRLFLPTLMFLDHSAGFILLVPDWMDLSTELDSYKGQWMQSKSGRPATLGIWQR